MGSEPSSTKTLRSVLGALMLSLACGREQPPAPAPAPVQGEPKAAEPPAEDKVYEVNIASNPSGAKVLLEAAELGLTPHVMRFKEQTSLLLSLDGYRTAEVTVGPDSDPNVVVQLTAMPGGTGAVVALAPTETGAASAAKSASTSSKPRASSDVPEPVAEPAVAPIEAKPVAPKPSGLPYGDVAAAKADYQAGKINRDAYDQAVRKLKVRRNEKLLEIKELYRTGTIDKDEYQRRKRIIDNEYRGT
jgi:PEGA domain